LLLMHAKIAVAKLGIAGSSGVKITSACRAFGSARPAGPTIVRPVNALALLSDTAHVPRWFSVLARAERVLLGSRRAARLSATVAESNSRRRCNLPPLSANPIALAVLVMSVELRQR
jgi:hypothetical protein